jgi:hypothetical protein
MQRKLLGIIKVDFDTTYFRKKREYSETVKQLFMDFKKAYDSVRMQVIHSIPIAFDIPMKIVKLIKSIWRKIETGGGHL